MGQQVNRLKPALKAASSSLVAFVVLCAVALFLVPLLWSPHWVAWTKNAYPMAVAGVWVGIDSFIAIISKHFIDFYGRTTLSIILVSSCFATLFFAIYKFAVVYFEEQQ